MYRNVHHENTGAPALRVQSACCSDDGQSLYEPVDPIPLDQLHTYSSTYQHQPQGMKYWCDYQQSMIGSYLYCYSYMDLGLPYFAIVNT